MGWTSPPVDPYETQTLPRAQQETASLPKKKSSRARLIAGVLVAAVVLGAITYFILHFVGSLKEDKDDVGLRYETAKTGPADSAEVALARTQGAIQQAISIGAPLYNMGNIRGCAMEYKKVLNMLLQSTLPGNVRDILKLSQNDLTNIDWKQDAWTMRRGFDKVLALQNATAMTSPSGSSTGTAVAENSLLNGSGSGVNDISTSKTPLSLSTAKDQIQTAIEIGAPKYNAGDIEGCARDYKKASTLLLQSTIPGNVREILETSESKLTNLDWKADAWTLRDGFDKVLALNSGTTMTEPEEGLKSGTEGTPPAVDSTVDNSSSSSVNSDTPVVENLNEETPSLTLSVCQNKIMAAIQSGAPKYNSGNMKGCAEDYMEALTSILDSRIPGNVREILTLSETQLTNFDWRKDAWTMRHGFDKVLMLRNAGTAMTTRKKSIENSSSNSVNDNQSASSALLSLEVIQGKINAAIRSGAPKYDQGDIEGCYRDYVEVVKELIGLGIDQLGDQIMNVLDDASSGLLVPEKEVFNKNVEIEDFDHDAWKIRRTFDEILGYTEADRSSVPILGESTVSVSNSSSENSSEVYVRFPYDRYSISLVNDGVMGGISSSTWQQTSGAGRSTLNVIADPLMPTLDTIATYSGTVRTEYNGGFASARYYAPRNLSKTIRGYKGFWVSARKAAGNSLVPSGTQQMELSVQVQNLGQYTMNISVDSTEFKLYQFSWEPSANEEWTKSVLGWRRSYSGRVNGFEVGSNIISQISLYASKPKIVGDFAIDIGGIGVWK